MKLGELIAVVDAMRPNRFDNNAKYAWVSDLEARVQVRILGVAPRHTLSYTYPNDSDKELLCGEAWGRMLYTSYLCSVIDLATADAETYRASREIFDRTWSEMTRWYIGKYDKNMRKWIADYTTVQILSAMAPALFGGTLRILRAGRTLFWLYDGDTKIGTVDISRRVPRFWESETEVPSEQGKRQLEKVSELSLTGAVLTFLPVANADHYVIYADGREMGTVI